MKLAILSSVVGAILTVSSFAQSKPTDTNAQSTTTTLVRVDHDASAVLAIRARSLQAGYELVRKALPEQRGVIDLVALGATTVLGFHPFQTQAWKAAGFDSDAPIVVQMPTKGPGRVLWRTRVVLTTRDLKTAIGRVSKLRLRKRLLLKGKRRGLTTVIDGLGAKEIQAQRHLLQAGVFFVGAPSPNTLVLARSAPKAIIVDILVVPEGALDWKRHGQEIQGLLTPPRRSISIPAGDAAALTRAELGLWLRPVPMSQVLGGSAECANVQRLAKQSSFRSIGLSLDLKAAHLRLEIDFMLKADSDLSAQLKPAKPLSTIENQDGLQLSLQLAGLPGLRDRVHDGLDGSWDRLWADSRKCSELAKGFALAFAWPEITGLFLKELEAMGPSAKRVITSARSLEVQLQGELAMVEAWLGNSGAADARRWLRTLFGHEIQEDSKTRWGRGPWRPYALTVTGGSIIGIGNGAKAQELGLSAKRKPRAQSYLLSVAGNPALLAKHPGVPLAGFWALWKHTSGSLIVESKALHFTLDLDSTQKPR